MTKGWNKAYFARVEATQIRALEEKPFESETDGIDGVWIKRKQTDYYEGAMRASTPCQTDRVIAHER